MTAQTAGVRKKWPQGGDLEGALAPAAVADLRMRLRSIHCAAFCAGAGGGGLRPLVLGAGAASGVDGALAAAAAEEEAAAALLLLPPLLLAGGGVTRAASDGWRNGQAAHLRSHNERGRAQLRCARVVCGAITLNRSAEAAAAPQFASAAGGSLAGRTRGTQGLRIYKRQPASRRWR